MEVLFNVKIVDHLHLRTPPPPPSQIMGESTDEYYFMKHQVGQLVAQLFQMRVRMKNLMGVMEGGSIPALNNLEEALKAEQKVPPSFLLSLFYILV